MRSRSRLLLFGILISSVHVHAQEKEIQDEATKLDKRVEEYRNGETTTENVMLVKQMRKRDVFNHQSENTTCNQRNHNRRHLNRLRYKRNKKEIHRKLIHGKNVGNEVMNKRDVGASIRNIRQAGRQNEKFHPKANLIESRGHDGKLMFHIERFQNCSCRDATTDTANNKNPPVMMLDEFDSPTFETVPLAPMEEAHQVPDLTNKTVQTAAPIEELSQLAVSVDETIQHDGKVPTEDDCPKSCKDHKFFVKNSCPNPRLEPSYYECSTVFLPKSDDDCMFLVCVLNPTCSGGNNTSTVPMQCPAGTYFDTRVKRCDHKCFADRELNCPTTPKPACS